MRRINYLWALFLATLLVMLMGCGFGGGDAKAPAPIGEYAVLEQLAEAYRTVSEQYAMQPQAMHPKGRRDFLRKVFAQAGYSYSASLLALKDVEFAAANKDQRDFVELVLIPGKGLVDADLAAIYSADELLVVRRLRKVFR